MRFVLAGGVNTLFGWGLFLVLLQFPFPLWLVLALANVGAILFNFHSIGRWAFRAKVGLGQGIRFLFAYLLLYVLNLAALHWAKDAGISLVFASGALIPPMALLSYALNRLFVFRGG